MDPTNRKRQPQSTSFSLPERRLLFGVSYLLAPRVHFDAT